MAPLSIAVRRVALLATLAVLWSLLLAYPAAAHAELVDIGPENGAQLTRPPTEVRMTFTESVNLVNDGIRLVDHVGATVPTPDRRGRSPPSPGFLPQLATATEGWRWRLKLSHSGSIQIRPTL